MSYLTHAHTIILVYLGGFIDLTQAQYAFWSGGPLGCRALSQELDALDGALNWLGTSTFHAQHHHDEGHNYRFYFVVWDRLLGTPVPDYVGRHGERLSGKAEHESK